MTKVQALADLLHEAAVLLDLAHCRADDPRLERRYAAMRDRIKDAMRAQGRA